MSLLDVRDLAITFHMPTGPVRAVDRLSFSIAAGEALGIVGESGAGKSQTALALLGLQPPGATVQGSIQFDGQELVGLRERTFNRLRGHRIAMIFQDPMTSLNPYLRVGDQVGEVLRRHRGMSKAQARAECERLFDAVKIPAAAQRVDSYPHELSGGQRQRVMIAIALAGEPELLLADEPTTALDMTVQAQVVGLLEELRHSLGIALLLITHDLGLVGELCDRVLVMYAGREVESGPTPSVLRFPAHPYTRGLLDARPRLDSPTVVPLQALPGAPPALDRLPPGCAFAPRCAFAHDVCVREVPRPAPAGPGRTVACVRAGPELARRLGPR
jgi:oligopeptide transport system ATP-binding protein